MSATAKHVSQMNGKKLTGWDRSGVGAAGIRARANLEVAASGADGDESLLKAREEDGVLLSDSAVGGCSAGKGERRHAIFVDALKYVRMGNASKR